MIPLSNEVQEFKQLASQSYSREKCLGTQSILTDSHFFFITKHTEPIKFINLSRYSKTSQKLHQIFDQLKECIFQQHFKTGRKGKELSVFGYAP